MSVFRIFSSVFCSILIVVCAAQNEKYLNSYIYQEHEEMNLLVIGTGYVGLVTGACFAEMGHRVVCLDIDIEKINRLKKGEIPIFEPGLEEIVKRNVKAGRLKFTTNYEEGIKNALACFIAVPTPSDEDGSCDLKYVLAAASEIGKYMNGYKLIVNKSTIPVGTGKKVEETIRNVLRERGVNYPFDMVSNPEFLKEGTAVSDCLKPDRIILGVENPQAACIMKEIYSAFTLMPDRIIVMDLPSAELTKYAANAMLATRISFMNEIAALCEKVGADINNIQIGIGADTRIGSQFLKSGIGYGGSCFPKDIRALQAMAREVDLQIPLLAAVDTINQNQKRILPKKMQEYFGSLHGKKIAIWGVSFKPDTDDMREAPSLQIIPELLAQGAILRVFDPIAMERAAQIFPADPNLTFCESEYEAATGVDGIALLTEWKQFRFVDLERIHRKMRGKGFFDGRNLYKAQDLRSKGFEYFGIGVP